MENPIKRIIQYLKLEFIVDKGFDFLMIFVGLYAALALENSVAEKHNLDSYTEDLVNFYVEVAIPEVSDTCSGFCRTPRSPLFRSS